MEKGLAVALEQAEEVISLLLDHDPHTWSLRILQVGRVASVLPVYSSSDFLQWCVDVATSANRPSSVGQTTAVGLLPEDSVQQWLQHPSE